MTYAVLVYPTAITGVSLNGINDTVFDFLNNTGVVGLSVLRTGAAYVIPIEENDLTGRRLKAAVLPLSTVLEPLHPIDTACELRNNAAVDIAALIRTPRYKAGAPLHTRAEAVPRPVWLPSGISDLR